MTTLDTSAAVDWITLTTPQFVGWARSVDLAIPYPLSTGDVPYLDAPGEQAITDLLRARALDDSPVLAAARVALGEPRLTVYAVRIDVEGRESKYVAAAGVDDEHAVLVLLDDRSVSIRTISDTELAAGVVGSLPGVPGLRLAGVEVPVSALESIDALVENGETARTVRAEMLRVGLPAELVYAYERTPPGPLPTGVLGAVGRSSPAGGRNVAGEVVDDGIGKHATRNASWREFPDGALLQIERGARHGEPVVALVPYGVDALFRAAVDAVSSIYEAG